MFLLRTRDLVLLLDKSKERFLATKECIQSSFQENKTIVEDFIAINLYQRLTRTRKSMETGANSQEIGLVDLIT